MADKDDPRQPDPVGGRGDDPDNSSRDRLRELLRVFMDNLKWVTRLGEVVPHHWRERILRLLDHLERNLASYGQLKLTALIGAIAAVIFVLGWMYCRIVATSRALTADKAELNQNATTIVNAMLKNWDIQFKHFNRTKPVRMSGGLKLLKLLLFRR